MRFFKGHLAKFRASLGAAAAILLAQPAAAQAPSFADLADLALTAPVVAHVRVRDADVLSAREAGTVAPGHRRVLIEAEVVALIRADGGLPSRISYLVDLPVDAHGRAPRVPDGTQYLVMASRAPGRPDELRLTAPDAQLPFDATAAATVRAILQQASGPGAPPRITGFGRAFHVPGALAGESETQIFMVTADGRPISLNVLRRPNQLPRWAVALGEMVDDAAEPPRRDTLLWYRLACSLPATLPRQALSEATPAEAQAILIDYQVVQQGLGRCVRNRVRR